VNITKKIRPQANNPWNCVVLTYRFTSEGDLFSPLHLATKCVQSLYYVCTGYLWNRHFARGAYRAGILQGVLMKQTFNTCIT